MQKGHRYRVHTRTRGPRIHEGKDVLGVRIGPGVLGSRVYPGPAYAWILGVPGARGRPAARVSPTLREYRRTLHIKYFMFTFGILSPCVKTLRFDM